MKKLTFFIISILTLVLAQTTKTNTIQLKPIQTDTDSVFVINSSKDLYYIKVKTNTGGVLGGVVLAMNQSTGDLSLTIGGATYTANLGTQNDFESASYSNATGEITLTANDGTNTVLTIDGSETKLTGGAGISLTGNGTSATPYNVEALDVSPTNELQTLGLSGQVLSISGANSLTLPNTSPVVVASNDLMISGGNLMTGAPLVQNTETPQNGFTRSFTGGNFGIGTTTPQNALEINSTTIDSTGLRFTQVNKYTPKSTGETSYLAVNSLGNVVVGEQIDLCNLARLNARAYAAPDSALFWNGDSLYLDDFSVVAAQFSKSTWNASATLQPSNDINDRVYRFGDVAIGNTSSGGAKLRIGANNFFAANTPKASEWISDNGGRLYIGDNGAGDGITAHNVSIGEFGGTDTDVLQLHGKYGVNITGNNGTYGADIVNVRVATNGNVGIGNTSPANKLHIGSAFVPNTGGIRLPITSASPVQTGQAIGVDANGDIVVIAASTGGGITSLGGQTGAAQTLSVTNTTATQGWTSATDNHSLNLRAWDLNGNAGTSASTNFVGTTDAVDLVFRTNNLEKLRITQAGRLLLSNTGGSNLNTFLGQNTGNESNSGGNVGIGANALQLVSTGIVNTAVGVDALKSLTTGTRNAAFGYLAGSMLQTGSFNTALGMNAMLNSVSANNTIGIGFQAFNNFNGTNSIAIGQSAGNMQTAGSNNIFIGPNATTGNVSNTASNQLNLNSWIYGDNGKIGLNGKLIPESNLVVNGSFATNVQVVASTSALAANASKVIVNNGATAITITLPNPALFPSRWVSFTRAAGSTGTITLATAAGQIQALNGALGATTSISAHSAAGAGLNVNFWSDGVNWYR